MKFVKIKNLIFIFIIICVFESQSWIGSIVDLFGIYGSCDIVVMAKMEKIIKAKDSILISYNFNSMCNFKEVKEFKHLRNNKIDINKIKLVFRKFEDPLSGGFSHSTIRLISDSNYIFFLERAIPVYDSLESRYDNFYKISSGFQGYFKAYSEDKVEGIVIDKKVDGSFNKRNLTVFELKSKLDSLENFINTPKWEAWRNYTGIENSKNIPEDKKKFYYKQYRNECEK
jgi:hypothetical protein